jgi:hypothetical protein
VLVGMVGEEKKQGRYLNINRKYKRGKMRGETVGESVFGGLSIPLSIVNFTL